MSLNRKLAHNTLVQFVGRAVGTLLALVAFSYLIRYLGPTEYGKFHIILTFVQLAGIIADFGLYLIVLNDISRPESDHNHIVSQHFMFRLYLNVIYLALMGLLALFIPYEAVIRWGIVLMALSNSFIWFGQIFQTLFQKNLITYYSAIAEIIGRGVLLLTTLIMIYYHAPLLPLTLTVVMGNFVSFVISWAFARRYVVLEWKVDRAYIREVIIRTWPVAISIWFSLFYFKADTIVLSWFRSDYEVGIYGMPYRILETLITLPILFMGLMMPLLSRAQSTGDQFKAYMQKGFDGLAFMAAPLFFITFPLAPAIVELLAGPAFAESVPLLQILMLGVSVIFMASLFAHAVITVEKQRTMSKYYFAIAIVMLTLYIILIPRYSYFAAAWLTVAGEILVFLSTFWVVYKETGFIPRLSTLGKALISAILMLGVLYPIRGLTLFLTIPLGVLVYGVLLYVTGAFKKGFITEIVQLRR